MTERWQFYEQFMLTESLSVQGPAHRLQSAADQDPLDSIGRDASDSLATPGLTVPQLAKRYRVSPDKIRNWIRRGELRAVNVASRLCGRPRFVVTPDALADFEKKRAAQSAAPKPARRKRLPKGTIDFFPD